MTWDEKQRNESDYWQATTLDYSGPIDTGGLVVTRDAQSAEWASRMGSR